MMRSAEASSWLGRARDHRERAAADAQWRALAEIRVLMMEEWGAGGWHCEQAMGLFKQHGFCGGLVLRLRGAECVEGLSNSGLFDT